MSKMNELYTLLNDSVKRAARRASTNWHGLLDADDIEQSLWVEILESPATVEKLTGSDDNHVVDLLARMADRICIRERDDYEHFSGNFRYSVNEAKVLVEEYFLRSGEELLVELIDVEIAYNKLVEEIPHYAEAVFLRYAQGVSPDTKATEHYLSKGLTKLTDYMNRSFKDRERDYRDGPGTRPSIPNGYDPYESI